MKDNSGRITAGLFVIFIGVVLLLNQFGGWFWGFNIFRFWPVILVLIGIMQLIKQKFTAAFILILIGLFLLAGSLFNLNVWATFWPLIIVVIGLSMIFRKSGSSYYSSEKKNRKSWTENGYTNASKFDTDTINDTVAFWGRDNYSTSKNFTGGNISCAFGGYRLDLREAKLAKNGAKLNINCAFGGVEVFVPEGVKVETDGTGFFGGWENHVGRGDTGNKNEPILHISGIAAFGGVEIK